MNNEPVAWMYRIKETDNRWELTWNKPTTKELFDTEPLYAHPVNEKQSKFDSNNKVKELTDEEIVRISETCDLNHVLGLIDFAKAILRKAQEK